MGQPSLWAKYIAEFNGAHMIEHSWGFIVFEMSADAVYIADIYIIPEMRLVGNGLKLVNEVEEIGRLAGKKCLLSQVKLQSKVCAETLKAHLNVGFIPIKAEADVIWLKRVIAEGGA